MRPSGFSEQLAFTALSASLPAGEPAVSGRRVISFGLPPACEDRDGEPLRIEEARDSAAAVQLYGHKDVAVLVIGPAITPLEAYALLARAMDEYPERKPAIVLIGIGSEVERFQSFIDADRIFYLSRGALTRAQIRSVITAAATRAEGASGALHLRKPIGNMAKPNGDVLQYCERMSVQEEPESVGALLVGACRDLMMVARAYYLIYDSRGESLWSTDSKTREERREIAAAGVVGYVVRTGEWVQVERLGDDPRFDHEADAPDDCGAVRCVAAPIACNGGRPLGVVTMIRGGDAPAFSADELCTLEFLTDAAGVALSVIALREKIRELTIEQTRPEGQDEVFRQEALDHFSLRWDETGEVLRAVPRWLRKTHWITLALLLAALLFLLFARVDERAAGPALVRARSKVAVVATAGGLVRSVAVTAGDSVRAGDLLVRFEDALGSTTLDSFNRQPRAPSDGVVTDVRVRAGQQVAPGDQVASIVADASEYELLAFLPGSYAPQLHEGFPMVLKIDGYANSHEVVLVQQVETEILTPREVARYAGVESIAVPSSSVIVRAILPRASFSMDGRTFSYHDGMTAAAEVSVRSEPMLVSLIPGAKALFGGMK